MYARVVGGRGRWHSFAPTRVACEQPCRARSEGELKLARRCVVLGSATIRIRSVVGRFRFRLSTNRPKSRRKIVTPGKALVLAVSKSSARRDQFLWQQCMPFCAVDCCESDLLFLCQRTSLIRRSIQATPPGNRLGRKPRVLAASPRELAGVRTRAPKAAPCPTLSA